MGNRYKLVAFDLDGTVLNYGGDITAASVRALEYVYNTGAVIAVSTGRHSEMVPQSVRELPFVRYIISASGAVILDREEDRELAVKALDKEDIDEIFRIGNGGKAKFHVAFADKNYSEWRSFLNMRRMWRFMKDAPMPGAGAMREMRRQIRLVWRAYPLTKRKTEPVIKIDCIYDSVEQCRQQLAQFRRMPRIEPVTTSGFDIEITAKGATKGAAVDLLCRELGVDKAQVLVFGDSGNDLSMRPYAGTFVAMGNASEDVRAVADLVTGTVGDEGVAQAVAKLYGIAYPFPD